jgi:hypothetical protein
MNYRGYKDLECYKEARLLRIFITELVKKFPAHEKFLLTAQVIDSSRSICRNMAEGYGRYTFTDEKYITPEELATGEEKCEQVFKLTNGYIGYLDKSKAVAKPNSQLQTPNS